MAVRKVIRLGNPLLRKKAEPVPLTEIRSKEMKKLIRDMFDTMHDTKGVGLAAPQIGVSKRIVVVGAERNDKNGDAKEVIERRVLFNPEIQVLTEKMEGYWEGCLSVPEMRGYVERGRKIKLKWYDEEESFHEQIFEGFPTVVFQHECDHLDGILYVDRLKSPQQFGFCDELDAAEENQPRTSRMVV